MLMEYPKKQIQDAKVAAKILHSILMVEDECSREREHIWVIGLNSQNVIQYVELVSMGTANTILCIPRDIFRMACIKGSIKIIMAHNHPSGKLKPSSQDRKTTEQVKKAGELLGISLLDSIIINEKGDFNSVMNI